jgi:hypothetical protein
MGIEMNPDGFPGFLDSVRRLMKAGLFFYESNCKRRVVSEQENRSKSFEHSSCIGIQPWKRAPSNALRNASQNLSLASSRRQCEA